MQKSFSPLSSLCDCVLVASSAQSQARYWHRKAGVENRRVEKEGGAISLYACKSVGTANFTNGDIHHYPIRSVMVLIPKQCCQMLSIARVDCTASALSVAGGSRGGERRRRRANWSPPQPNPSLWNKEAYIQYMHTHTRFQPSTTGTQSVGNVWKEGISP